MFCFKCGNQLPDNALFCNKCGEKINSIPVEICDDPQKTTGEKEKISGISVKSISCPNCGGMVDSYDGIDYCICSSCGNKFMLEGISAPAYKAKTKIKQYEHEETMQQNRYSNEHARWQRKEISKDNESKRELRSYLPLLILFVGMMVFLCGILAYQYISHAQRVKKLEKTTLEIEAAIEEKDYDKALILTNRLRLNDDWSNEETEEWEERREEYIRQIELLKKAEDQELLFAPCASDECCQYSKEQLVRLFKNAGFRNVTVQQGTGKTGRFVRENEIEKVTINGIETFSETDMFPKGSEVIIIYNE